MPDKVVDASVIACVVFEEPRMEEAAALVGDALLLEPPLLLYELASIASKKIAKEPAKRAYILGRLYLVSKLKVKWFDQPDLELLVTLALDASLSVYDASYLHIAQTTGSVLHTFDSRLAAAYRSLR
jgi:predicted nucleic acid-binding protein